MTPTRCTSYSDTGCIVEDRSATQDKSISRNRSYRDLQTSWLDFGGNLATPLFSCEGPRRRHESFPRAGGGEGGNSAPLPPAAPPPPRAYGIRPSHFPCFQFLPLQPPLPRRAYGFTALHDTIRKSKKKKSMASLAVTKTPANFFMTSGV